MIEQTYTKDDSILLLSSSLMCNKSSIVHQQFLSLRIGILFKFEFLFIEFTGIKVGYIKGSIGA